MSVVTFRNMRLASKRFQKVPFAPMVRWKLPSSLVPQNAGAYGKIFIRMLRERRNIHCSMNKSFGNLILDKLSKQEPWLICRLDYLLLNMRVERFFTATPRQSTFSYYQKHLKIT